ncbi:MAG: hypothetical protein JXA67_03045 [Micromonosporaceae bacterium]|nr:hypothetical protein [Micromonosporaceae bacterium]
MASVAEVKAAIDAAITQVADGQQAVRLASERLTEAQQCLGAALEGSGHDLVTTAHAALAQAALELEECLTATIAAVDLATTYSASL